jgi:hypothetical protein
LNTPPTVTWFPPNAWPTTVVVTDSTQEGVRRAAQKRSEGTQLIVARTVGDAGVAGCVTALMRRAGQAVRCSGGCDVDRLV